MTYGPTISKLYWLLWKSAASHTLTLELEMPSWVLGLGFPSSSAGRFCLQCRRPGFNSWVGTIPRRRDRLPTTIFLGFPGGSDIKESAHGGDLGSIPVLGRSPGGGYVNPLQYSCLENPHGQRSLVGYSPWGCKESDMTVCLSTDKWPGVKCPCFLCCVCHGSSLTSGLSPNFTV